MNSVVVNSRRFEIQNGVLSLLLGQQPAAMSPHHAQGFPALIGVLGGTILVALGMVRSVLRLRRWRAHPKGRPRGALGVGRHLVLPFVLHLAWALLLLVGLPYVAQQSLSFMLHYTPDLGYATVIGGAIALGWGIIRTVLALAVLHLQPTGVSASAPIHA